MHQKLKTTLILFAAAGACGAGYVWYQAKIAGAKKPKADTTQLVRISQAEQKSMPINLLANGYVTAINTVDVRPQVQNIVREVHVKEGQEVRAGQLLITLDQRLDGSGVDKALAQVARDRADLLDADVTLKRNEELLGRKFVAQAVVDTARSKVEVLRSALTASQAAVKSSRISLDYNLIKASISGRIGIINVHPGSLAQPAAVAMMTITQLDPVAVSFTLPERELGTLRTTYPNGDAPVLARLASGKEVAGRLIFIDNAADAQSGTIRMKARFTNPDRLMWPGTFVSVRLVSRTLPDAVVVPAQAIVTGPVDKFLYLVQSDDSVLMQKVDVVAIEDGKAAVSGIVAGARIVVEGAQNLRSGIKVKELQVAATGAGGGGTGDTSAPRAPAP
ncbi:efflux RND transporter periplasmic adaptor subunit [Actimicrobium antarcticum]|uniref:Multidrug efflux RND transporter periplasmic adaptor subunit MuxA n=1 Tax=Actimicrobium antarcticum TaxID=1051899 RepID=A0ABP7TUM1_9BURK